MSVLTDLTELFKTPAGLKQYPHFGARLEQLKRDTRNIGWGYDDGADDLINDLADYAAYQGAD